MISEGLNLGGMDLLGISLGLMHLLLLGKKEYLEVSNPLLHRLSLAALLIALVVEDVHDLF